MYKSNYFLAFYESKDVASVASIRCSKISVKSQQKITTILAADDHNLFASTLDMYREPSEMKEVSYFRLKMVAAERRFMMLQTHAKVFSLKLIIFVEINKLFATLS